MLIVENGVEMVVEFIMVYENTDKDGELDDVYFHTVPKYASGVVSYPGSHTKRITYRHPVPLTRRGAIRLMREMISA